MDAHWKTQLFDGVESRLQSLLRNNANADWPGGLAGEIDIARRGELGHFLCPVNYGFRDSVINLPILLAARAATGEPMDWAQQEAAIRTLRTVQSFDQEWFSEAYDLTVARCLSMNVIPNQ